MSALIVDDMARDDLVSCLGTSWRLVTDRVMGGVSSGGLERTVVAGRPALRMRGEVSLENDGGFVQMALDLADDGLLDAHVHDRIELEVFGHGETYGVHLRTDRVTRPWQSWRQSFVAEPAWRTVVLPLACFAPHRIEAPLDRRRLRRIGLVAIGRAFTADLAVGGIRFTGG